MLFHMERSEALRSNSNVIKSCTAYVNGERQGVVTEKPFHLGDSIAREKASSSSSLSSIPVLDVEAEVCKAFTARESFDDRTMSQMMKKMGLERYLRSHQNY